MSTFAANVNMACPVKKRIRRDDSIPQYRRKMLIPDMQQNMATFLKRGNAIATAGVTFNELAKLFAMGYSWNGNSSWLDRCVFVCGHRTGYTQVPRRWTAKYMIPNDPRINILRWSSAADLSVIRRLHICIHSSRD